MFIPHLSAKVSEGKPETASRSSPLSAATVANVRRPAATALLAPLGPNLAPGPGRPLGQLEAQPAADRIGLRQPQGEALARRIGLAALLADQALAGLVVAEIFLAQGRCGDEAVAAELLDRGEEAERLHAGDPALDQLPDPVGEIGGDIAVHRLPLVDHRAPFKVRDQLAGHLHRLLLLPGHRAFAEPVGA